MDEARLAHLVCAGAPDAWAALGFTVDAEGRIGFVNGAVVFDADSPERRLTGLAIVGDADHPPTDGDLEGIPVAVAPAVPPGDHPNGSFELDHVVVLTDSIERTSAAVEARLGLAQRRVRDTGSVRQAFHRFAPTSSARGCIVELVERPDQVATALWGLVLNVADLDAVAADLGPDLLSLPKQAVQPGRRIATVRAAAGLGVPVALMST